MLAEALLVGAALCFVYLLIKYPNRAVGTHARPDLKGPKGYPLVGNLPDALTRSENVLEWFTLSRAEFGLGVSITLPWGVRTIDISSPEQIEYVQKTNFKNYAKGSLIRSIFHDVLGTGIFAADGAAWSVQRKSTSHIFTGTSFDGVITEAISSDLLVLEDILRLRSKTGDEFDLSALFFAFTLSSFVKMAFSKDIGCLSADSDAKVPFATAFDFSQNHMVTRFVNPFWRITERFSSSGKRMREAVAILDDFAYGMIDQRKNEVLESRGEKAKKDLLGLYLDTREETGLPISRKRLRDSILNIIVAGRDTTAQGLSWTFFRLLHSPPSLLATLRAEVDSLGEVTYRNYRSFVQLHAAWNEGLRLHPSVPKNAWEALSDDQIPSGPRIYAGERVRWSDWQMARDERVWGEDCCEYKPARWIDEQGGLRRESAWKFHVFNGGPRLCLGQNLANFEAISVMACVIRSFDLAFAEGYLENVEMLSVYKEDTPMYVNSLTLPMKEAFRVVAKRREQ